MFVIEHIYNYRLKKSNEYVINKNIRIITKKCSTYLINQQTYNY